MIDRIVERGVREIFGAVIAADDVRLASALNAVPDSQLVAAARLAFAVGRMVMADLPEEVPSAERFRSLARSFSQTQEWYQPETLPIEDFLRQLSGAPAAGIDAPAAGLLAFVVGGWLLAGLRPPESAWPQYLDEVLTRLEFEAAAGTRATLAASVGRSRRSRSGSAPGRSKRGMLSAGAVMRGVKPGEH